MNSLDAFACAEPGEACPASWLWPRFSSPRVGAVMTTRDGGVSAPPFDSMNLGLHVADDPAAVAANRERLVRRLGVQPVRLMQVHGCAVQALDDAEPGGAVPRADASFTTTPGHACEIQVADCLPVLFAARDGRVVGAAHAGWRGLAAGVLEACVARMTAAAACAPQDIEAWLGPCIGPARFEVGVDVLDAFGVHAEQASSFFTPLRPGKWLADLAGLARDRLLRTGLREGDLGGNDGSAPWCTVTQASRYFSFRRDGSTGRMAALVWLRG